MAYPWATAAKYQEWMRSLLGPAAEEALEDGDSDAEEDQQQGPAVEHNAEEEEEALVRIADV